MNAKRSNGRYGTGTPLWAFYNEAELLVSCAMHFKNVNSLPDVDVPDRITTRFYSLEQRKKERERNAIRRSSSQAFFFKTTKNCFSFTPLTWYIYIFLSSSPLFLLPLFFVLLHYHHHHHCHDVTMSFTLCT